MAMFSVDDITPEVEARFWAKVDQSGDCWDWTASKTRTGYGQFGLVRASVKATHVSLTLAGKPRPSADHQVLHSCDNPSCVNPEHLRWGTQAENNQDCEAKGRRWWQRGQSHYAAKLSPADIEAIKVSSLGCVALGKKFGISPSHANNIRKGRKWKHVV